VGWWGECREEEGSSPPLVAVQPTPSPTQSNHHSNRHRPAHREVVGQAGPASLTRRLRQRQAPVPHGRVGVVGAVEARRACDRLVGALLVAARVERLVAGGGLLAGADHGGVLVALGKGGTGKLLVLLKAAVHKVRGGDAGQAGLAGDLVAVGAGGDAAGAILLAAALEASGLMVCGRDD